MIDEQMKAPLPPPPSRRARRSTRASQARAPDQPDSGRQHEHTAPRPEAEPQHPNQMSDASGSRVIQSEETREDELRHAEPKQAEAQPESGSPEQPSAEAESPSQDQPGPQQDLSNKPAGHEDQSQLPETTTRSLPVGESDREAAEASAEDHAPAAQQATDEDQDSSSEIPDQAAPSSEKSEQPAIAASASVPSDAEDSVQKSLAEEEAADESSDVKEQNLHSEHGQERPRSLNRAASTDSESQSQDQALGVENRGIDTSPDNAKRSTEPPAAEDPQEAPSSQERAELSDQSTSSEVDNKNESATGDELEQSRSQPGADDPETTAVPAENGEGSDHAGLFHGVAKGGAAEEYVRMAEAESVQEPQLGANTSAVPEQDSSSGHGQQHEEHRDSSRGFEEPEPIQVDISTTEQDAPEYTRLAEDGEQPSSASRPADSAEKKAESPVGSEHGSDNFQSRDVESVDQQRPDHEPTLDQQKHVRSEHSELDHSQEPYSSSTGHAQPPVPSPNSPDAGSRTSEQLQEPGHGEQPHSENALPSSGPQQLALDPTYPEESEAGKPNLADASLSEEDHSGPKTAEGQREPYGDDQRGDAPRAMDDEQEHPGHDTGSQLEPDHAGQHGLSSPYLSVPATSSHDAQVEKDPGGSGGEERLDGQEPSQQSPESRALKEEHVRGDIEEQLPRGSSRNTPNVVELDDVDAAPHESASEHEPGDKRSDSGYETGMASSRNLEDSTATLHEGQPAQGAEHSFATASPEGEQEKTRESRPEQILEGSGKDASPPRLGGEQDSGSHLVEETFDLSGSEPIPGTMTHGKDQTGGQGEELADGDASSHDTSDQQPADNDAVVATPDENQRSPGINDSHKSSYSEASVPREPPQQANSDHVQAESQPTAHGAASTGSADSHNQGVEEQLQQGDSQSAVGDVGHEPSSQTESGAEPSGITAPQRRGSVSSTGQAEKSYPEGDVETPADRGVDELQQETSVEGEDAVVPAAQEPISDQSVPYSHARDASQDQFGSWNSQAFSRPADDQEFSFKKRADSVQVGRSQGPADRGADLPSINTDGPNEDADEGLFAVPPTPRNEVELEKYSQFQGDGDSKLSSRASSRNGSAGGDALSSRAVEGLPDSYSEGSDRASLPDTAARNDMDNNDPSQSQGDGPQASVDVTETPEGLEEKSIVPLDDAEGLFNPGEVAHGQPEEPVVTAAGEVAQEASTGNDDSHQGQHHGGVSLQAFEKQPDPSNRPVDSSRQPETSPSEQHGDSTMNKSEVIDDSGETRPNQARDNSVDSDAQSNSSTKEHDLKQGGSGFGHQGDSAEQSSHNANERDEATEDLKLRDMTTEPDSEQIRQESGETDSRSLGGNDQVQHGDVSESRTSEDQPRGVSPGAVESASDQNVDKKIVDPPHLDQGDASESQSGLEPKAEQVEQDHTNTGNTARRPSSPGHSSQHLDAQHMNYDGEGYGVTPSSEYSNDPLAEPTGQGQIEAQSADTSTAARQSEKPSTDSPYSAHATRNDNPMESGSETFETPFESADFRKPQEDSQSVTPGNFTRALDHLPDESAHTVQGTDDLFDDTDDAEDQDDYGEAVVYQNSNESAEISPSGEKTVYSTRGDENNTALGGHRSSLSLGSVGHRSQGSISSMRDTTPVRPTFGSYIGGPNVVRADWAAEHEDELRPPSSLNPTPQLGPSTTHDTPEISPFALRNTPMASHGSEQRGLNSSMWNPDRPQTPASATTQSNNPFATPQRQPESEFDHSLFVPRDVTHGRQDSVPASLHSQTTLDSSWSSPVHSSLPVDRHEPVIRDSWPAPAPGYQQYLSSWGSRPRGDTTSTAAEYDPFRPENGGAPGGQGTAKTSSSYNPFLQRGRAESSVSTAPSDPSASNSPSRGSALFAKMRNIFEGQGQNGASDIPASPGKTRPVSGVFHPVTSVQRRSQDSAPGERDGERGGFLNEADHEIDERSAFLRSDGQPSGH